jgi:hypothetical protein
MAQLRHRRTVNIPTLSDVQISQAVTAIEAAWKDGIKRQRLELLLPLIGATDLDDWPGGIRQQFKAAAPLMEGECADVVTASSR